MRSADLVCDNLIFELQGVGGVSKYWGKTIERIDRLRDRVTFLEGRAATQNIFRRDLRLRGAVTHDRGPTAVRRLIGPSIRCEVFHSSYYRTSSAARSNVVTIHDLINEKFPGRLQDRVLSYQKRKACARATRIAVVSEQTKRDLLSWYPFVDSGTVDVLYNGVDAEFYPEVTSEDIVLSSDLSVQPGGYFLYVGSRGYCKNFPYVLDFISEATREGLPLQLVAVGGGELTPQERLLIKQKGLPSYAVAQVSGLSNSVLRKLYSNTAALLIPSIYEGFGIPAAEGARCGALVLASQTGALREVTGDTDFSFDLGRPKEIQRVLTLGLDSTEARKERMRMQERSTRFDWDASAKRLLEIYDELSRGHK